MSQEALLKEYEIAHNEVSRLNQQLWTTAQILVPLSLAGIGLFANFADHSIQTFTTILLSGIISSLILSGWYSIAHRWLRYQSVAQHRLIEIEEELGLWCTRYELFAGGKRNSVVGDIDRFKKIPLDLAPKGQPTAVVIRNLVVLMIVSWALLALRELAFVAKLL